MGRLGLVSGETLDLVEDGHRDELGRSQRLLIGEPENLDACGRQVSVPLRVVAEAGFVPVLSAVDLDGAPGGPG